MEETEEEKMQRIAQKIWDENPWKTWTEAKSDAKQIVASWR